MPISGLIFLPISGLKISPDIGSDPEKKRGKCLPISGLVLDPLPISGLINKS